jgi:hypothetical protein
MDPDQQGDTYLLCRFSKTVLGGALNTAPFYFPIQCLPDAARADFQPILIACLLITIFAWHAWKGTTSRVTAEKFSPDEFLTSS